MSFKTIVTCFRPFCISKVSLERAEQMNHFLSALSYFVTLFVNNKIIIKPCASRPNTFGQQLRTLLNVTCCIRLHTLLNVVGCYCMLLRVVEQSLKPVKHLATCKRTHNNSQHCWANNLPVNKKKYIQ